MLKLPITAEHIKESEPLIEEKSPLAIALREVFPNSLIHVGMTLAQVDNCILKLSPKVVAYLENYDIKGKANPIDLEMQITIK